MTSTHLCFPETQSRGPPTTAHKYFFFLMLLLSPLQRVSSRAVHQRTRIRENVSTRWNKFRDFFSLTPWEPNPHSHSRRLRMKVSQWNWNIWSTRHLAQVHFLKLCHFRCLFLYFSIFNALDSAQLFNINFADDSIWTTDLCCLKQPLFQLNPNHCPALVHFPNDISTQETTYMTASLRK